MNQQPSDIPIWKIVMVASQFDFVCDEIKEITPAKFNATTPHVVNSALTCELYLKALYLITQGRTSREHDLKELYLLQNDRVKESIYKEYFTLHQTREVPSKYRSEMNEKIFEQILEEVKRVFVEWRYIYEVPNESIRLGLLEFLRLALRKVTRELYNELS
jgi:HEPN domain-containing protein